MDKEHLSALRCQNMKHVTMHVRWNIQETHTVLVQICSGRKTRKKLNSSIIIIIIITCFKITTLNSVPLSKSNVTLHFGFDKP